MPLNSFHFTSQGFKEIPNNFDKSNICRESHNRIPHRVFVVLEHGRKPSRILGIFSKGPKSKG